MSAGFKIADAFVDVHAKIDSLDREVKSGVDKATRAADSQARSGGSGIGKSLMAGFAGGIAAVGVGGIFKSIIGGASDLQETINKSNVIFGQQAKAIEGWAGSAARNVGLSKQAALEAAASFGNMFTQLGFSGQAAADMSTKVVQMSADLGSFNNLPTAQVADMISAAFRGEYDSLQALIPNINAARVEKEALAMSGKKNADALTAQEKAAATLALVEKDGALAAGDFARTSESLANQQKIVAAQFQDTAARLGTQLLPAITVFAGFVSERLIPGIEAFANRMGPGLMPIIGEVKAFVVNELVPAAMSLYHAVGPILIPALEWLGQTIGTVIIPTLSVFTGFIRENTDVVRILAIGVTTMLIPAMLTAGTTALVAGANIARGWIMAMGPFGLVVAGLTGIVSALVWAWQNSETFRNIVNGCLNAVGAAASYLWNTFIRPNFDAMMGHFRMLGNTATWLWQNAVQPAMNGIGGVVTAVWNSTIRPAFDGIRFALDAVGRGFQNTVNWISDQWNRLRDAVRHPVNAVIDIWNNVNNLWGGEDIRHFATGGKVPGQGSRDIVPAMLTPGEFVVRKGIAEPTRRFLEALNAGQAEAVQAAGGMFGRVQGFAAGGAVGIAQKWAAGESGKPYIWGGVGPAGYDCSGFMSAITNVLRGRNPHSRLGVAASQPWAGFQRGMGSAFSTGFSQGHTAGTLGGVNVESGGSPSRTKYGAGAAGADHPQFPGHAFLPDVGGIFASGGASGGIGEVFAGLARSAIEAALTPLSALVSSLPGGPPILKGVPRVIASKIREFMTAKALSFVGHGAAGGGVTPVGGSSASGPVIDQVRAVAARFGWSGGAEWDALSALIQKESSWNPAAANPSSSARGLFQKMTSIHGPVEPTAGGQAEWGLNYIRGRYGSPSAAWAFHRGHNYYDQGGMLPRGLSSARNSSGRPERVLSAEQTASFERLVAALERGDRDGVTVNVTQTSGSPAETGRFVALALRTVG